MSIEDALKEDVERFRSLSERRREQGHALRKVVASRKGTLSPALSLELLAIADAIECNSPDNDCGCEGSCLTSGED